MEDLRNFLDGCLAEEMGTRAIFDFSMLTIV
jgi:hypothetical protein